MALIIGKATLTSDAVETRHVVTGKKHTATISVSANVSTHRTAVREQCRHHDRISEMPVPNGDIVYIDTSQHNSNTVYVETNSYTGYAMIVNYSEEGDRPTLFRFTVTFAELCDLTQYYINLEAEDNNSAGTDTADSECSNGEKVVYSPTPSSVNVLDTGALHLDAGTYSAYACAYAETTHTGMLQGATPSTTGSWLGFSAAGEWEMIDLGNFTVSDGTDDIQLNVKDESNTNDIWIDYILIRKESSTARRTGSWDSATWG